MNASVEYIQVCQWLQCGLSSHVTVYYHLAGIQYCLHTAVSPLHQGSEKPGSFFKTAQLGSLLVDLAHQLSLDLDSPVC